MRSAFVDTMVGRFCTSAAAVALLSLSHCACPGPTASPDAGPQSDERTCLLDSECKSGESCVSGLCLRRCSLNDVCDVGYFCSPSGYCESGCRASDECTDGKLCARGACVTSSGTCATKADCTSGLVCKQNACVAPPASCATPEDCPDEQLCNGFTQVCFDPAPTGCNNAGDCVGKAGCEAGCTCNGAHTCVTGTACTAATEANDCGVGGTCHQSACIPTPACTAQANCDTYGLYCDVPNRICTRTSTCQGPSDCTSQAPATYCNTTAHRCEVPNCRNGGVTCSAPNNECGSDGRCVPPAGATCSSNLECCPDAPPSGGTCGAGVQYCDIPSGQVAGVCRAGCRSNTDCNVGAGQTCNSLHQCGSTTTSGGGDGDPCAAQEECRANYFCGSLSGVCREKCDNLNEGDTCPETGKTCTAVLGFLMLCMGELGLPTLDGGLGGDI